MWHVVRNGEVIVKESMLPVQVLRLLEEFKRIDLDFWSNECDVLQEWSEEEKRPPRGIATRIINHHILFGTKIII